ncbi:related to Vacuolar protein sorting-associated protein 75 [Zygosaccharomyces bailii ISA1307]|nr:related to Vacuolar protein sorting-associated protein 75 [Zygosaccharomyces bailii ISA1307]
MIQWGLSHLYTNIIASSASALDELADCEQKLEKTEKELEWHRLKTLMPQYAQRDAIIAKIPNFWKIVLSQHDDFANYIRAADFKYVDAIESVVVQWQSLEDFDIIIKFHSVGKELPEQSVKKHFHYEDEKLTSKRAELVNSLPPKKRRNQFFDWFKWEGLGDKGEFPNGDGLALLFAEEIYPLCVKFYTQAQSDVADEESSEESSEPELL